MNLNGESVESICSINVMCKNWWLKYMWANYLPGVQLYFTSNGAGTSIFVFTVFNKVRVIVLGSKPAFYCRWNFIPCKRHFEFFFSLMTSHHLRIFLFIIRFFELRKNRPNQITLIPFFFSPKSILHQMKACSIHQMVFIWDN